MDMERLTIKSQEALQEAQRIAQGFSHQQIDGEHLMLAMLGQQDSLIPSLLEKIGVPPAKLRPDLEGELARRHKVQGISSSELFLSTELKKVLDAAQTEAGKLKDDYISTEPGVFRLSNPYWSANARALILQPLGPSRRAGSVRFTAPDWS
jgi:ATP-dependent Clp protease ATP-binding subunit ClpB